MRSVTRATALLLLTLALCWPASADPPVGWRQDGSGRFPKASPPAEWAKDSNVLWKTKMPGSSFGSPILVGGNLFVVSDPAELLCVRPSDGKVLWKQSTPLAEVFGAEKTKEAAGRYKALDDERNRLAREHGKLRKEEPDAKEKLDRLRGQIREAEKKIQELEKTLPRPEGRRASGNTAATPVSDGKHVAVVFGNGIAACYTVEGKRLWARFIETSPLGFGHSASPALVGGKLVVHLRDLVALDLAAGKEVWRTPLPAAHASPVAARVENEDVLFTPSGAAVRARDGKVLLKARYSVSECTPLVQDGVLYVSRSGSAEAYRIEMADGRLALTELWKGTAANGRRTPSSLLHAGLLYGLTTDGMLDVTDAKTGEKVYRQRLPMTQVYSSLTLAGPSVYVLDTRGKAVVFRAGRRYQPSAQNQLEGTGACPVAAGGRLFVRGQQHLYCLSASEQPGKGR